VSPLFALKRAIHARLVGDAPLLALLGGPRVYEEAAKGLAAPYLVFGEARLRDWSTVSDRGHEHALTVDALAADPGALAVLALAERVETLLHDAPLPLDGHRLVNLTVIGIDLRRDGREPIRRAVTRLRAVTEVLP
jgi:hypothetical protein